MAGTIKQNQIAKMAGQMPGIINAQANQAASNQTTALQTSIAQAAQVPAPGGTASAGQTLGAQQATQSGQTATVAQQQINQAQQQAGQQILQQGAQEAQQRLQRKAIKSQQENRDAQTTLSNLSSDLKDKLFDSNLVFNKDEMGRTSFNERQLLDYKLSQGMSDEDLANYEQQVNEVSQKRLQILQTASAKIKQELSQSFQAGQQTLDQDQQRFLVQKQHEIEAKIKKEKAKQANRASAFVAVGTIAGAVIGGLYTGGAAAPAGAAIGASAGGALGSLAASS